MGVLLIYNIYICLLALCQLLYLTVYAQLLWDRDHRHSLAQTGKQGTERQSSESKIINLSCVDLNSGPRSL